MKKINLRKDFFTEKETLFYQDEEYSVVLFKYPSGIEAVKLCNSVGHITVLPYFGQMIWDSEFYGMSNKMKSNYTQPKKVMEFFDTDGCYLMHCGPRRICDFDNPFKLVHGELPMAEYDSACIVFDEDERGSFAAVSGTYVYNRHRGDQYTATPIARVYPGSAVIKVTMAVTNTSGYPMDYMALFHTNYEARDNGRFVQPVRWTTEDMSIFVPTSEEGLCPDALDTYRAYLKSPEALRVLGEGNIYEPEFCVQLNNPVAAADGMYHFLQVDPSGYADYCAVPADGPLNFLARWITRGKDHSAASMCQPASCGTKGYAAEKALGHVPQVQPGDTITATVLMGLLKPEEAAATEKMINDLMK